MNAGRVGLVLGALLIALLAAEGVARLGEERWAPSFREARGAMEGHLPPHPYLGWEPVPGRRVEAGVDVRINSIGIRGPEPGPRVRPRLVATGDSSVYGFGVEERERFVDVAAARLGMEPWAVAVPGYSSLQTLHWLRLRGDRVVPDILVIANLWSDHSVESWVDHELLATPPDGRGLWWSALVRVLHYQLGVRRGARADRRIHWQRAGARPPDGPPRVSLSEYRDNLEAIAEWAEERGAAVVMLPFAHPCDVAGCRVPDSFEAYREVQRSLGRPVVEGRDVFRASGLPVDALWLDGIHPTAEGHRLLGAALP
ncbi:MAG: hypothetical protein D6798_14120 [Deltaproteobacteria bacterium]|nr:MAG: hypothetical protein D6798_14120 [Deltaproteobacteria bacterium]